MIDEKDSGFAVVDDIEEVARHEPVIERYQHRTDGRHAVKALQKAVAVGTEDRDSIALADAEFRQRVGKPVYPFAEGPVIFALVTAGGCELVRIKPESAVQEIGEQQRNFQRRLLLRASSFSQESAAGWCGGGIDGGYNSGDPVRAAGASPFRPGLRRRLQINVAFLPALLPEPVGSVCIVVDVLRASSSCVTLLDAGAGSIAVAATVEEARELRSAAMPDALLCGEIGGLPPAGFDYGNSAVEFVGLDLAHRRVVMATSNGTRALARVAAAPAVFVGCLLNRAAVCDASLAAARSAGAGITVVCSGNEYGSTASLEDTLGAGALVAGIEERLIAAGAGDELELTDAALMAGRLFAFYDEDLAAGLRAGSHGRTLARLGFHADLDFCARLDRSISVPCLRRSGSALLLTRVSPDGGGC